VQSPALLPPPSRIDPVNEQFHGESVPDPYRWLEDGSSDETHSWVDAQNRYTADVLARFPGRDAIARRLQALLSIGMAGVPAVRGDQPHRYFYQRREGGQNQPVLYVRDGLNGVDRALVDPNAESAAGTVALDWYYPSRDGKLLAYGLSDNGSELSTLHVMEVETGERTAETIDRTRYASLAWLPDGSGFYFTRLPEPGSVPAGEEQYHRRLYLHQLGTDPNRDLLIWSERRDMREQPDVSLSSDGRWLLLTISLGWDRSDVFVRDLAGANAEWQSIAVDEPALFYGQIYRDTLYLFTNLEAPRYRVVAVPLADPRRERWQEIVAEQPDAMLSDGRIVGGSLALHYLIDASSRLELRARDGSDPHRVPLPALGTISTLSGEADGDELFFDYSSFTVPVTIYRLALGDDGEAGVPAAAPVVWAAIPSPLATDAVAVEQLWYFSTGGARVSMFVAHRRDVQPNGKTPVLLTGYGGFNINRTPGYSAGITFWLEQGGVLALPNLRGGGEYGESWHRDGMLDRKQHTFDDFIRAAEHLIANGYTNPDRLAILGGSNGGLLVGAAITQRPELFRAAVCQVPLLDMLRYHRFLIARLWIAEYGSAEDPEQYRWLRAYSPYHRVEQRRRYPAVLFTTAASDSRVEPLHARKMAALLQASQTAPPAERPILLRVETRAGHGQGKPIVKVIEEQTDVWSFVCSQLGVAVRN